jgi:hypothetical protein
MPDPVTKTLFEHYPLLFTNFSGFLGNKTGNHTIFDPTLVRVTMVVGAPLNSGLRPVTITKNAATGDTIYLTYFADEITSVRLSNPPIAGVSKFTTDNLSGCKVFVDKIGATNDLILYHANAKAQSPPSNWGGVRPSYETPAAAQTLDALHANAVLGYAGAPHHLAPLVPVGSVNKPLYNQNANNLTQRKKDQGRLRAPQLNELPDPNRVDAPEFVGGTVVFGFYVIGSGWEIYYQTWGDIEYKRPKTAVHAKRTMGPEHRAQDYKLVQFGRIYPFPFTRNL